TLLNLIRNSQRQTQTDCTDEEISLAPLNERNRNRIRVFDRESPHASLLWTFMDFEQLFTEELHQTCGVEQLEERAVNPSGNQEQMMLEEEKRLHESTALKVTAVREPQRLDDVQT
ncbi:hypothetical protein M9458_022865, partial [Cirrhinus mrigala]